MAVIASMLISLGATRAVAATDTDVIVASGTLDGQFLAGSLLHIGEFWMKVLPDSEFQRWLSQGKDRTLVITITTHPERFADVENIRILSGTLMRGTAPNPTPVLTDVVGRLPYGNTAIVHVLYLKDELTGSLGPITFETADLLTAKKFDPYDNAPINIILKIE